MIREVGGEWTELAPQKVEEGKTYEVLGEDERVFKAQVRFRKTKPILEVDLSEPKREGNPE